MLMNNPVVLSIAGSDSGGGAGIQADLRTFSAIGVFGTTAITALTAQNLNEVRDVMPATAKHLEAQIKTVLDGFEVTAIKTGMLFSKELVLLVAALLKDTTVPLVVDPVMVSTSGAALLDPGAIDAYAQELFPRATLITPNLDEAKVLTETGLLTSLDLGQYLFKTFGCPILLKGGHAEGDRIDDMLFVSPNPIVMSHPRIKNINTHGSGCTLSAAITAFLAQGQPLQKAVQNGVSFLHERMRESQLFIEGKPTPQLLIDIESHRAKTAL